MTDASSKLPELCDTVERTGEPVQLTVHGRPVAILSRWIQSDCSTSIWAARKKFEHEFGPLTEDFELPARKIDVQTLRNPLD